MERAVALSSGPELTVDALPAPLRASFAQALAPDGALPERILARGIPRFRRAPAQSIAASPRRTGCRGHRGELALTFSGSSATGSRALRRVGDTGGQPRSLRHPRKCSQLRSRREKIAIARSRTAAA